jgi:hypothetical protein
VNLSEFWKKFTTIVLFMNTWSPWQLPMWEKMVSVCIAIIGNKNISNCNELWTAFSMLSINLHIMTPCKSLSVMKNVIGYHRLCSNWCCPDVCVWHVTLNPSAWNRRKRSRLCPRSKSECLHDCRNGIAFRWCRNNGFEQNFSESRSDLIIDFNRAVK